MSLDLPYIKAREIALDDARTAGNDAREDGYTFADAQDEAYRRFPHDMALRVSFMDGYCNE